MKRNYINDEPQLKRNPLYWNGNEYDEYGMPCEELWSPPPLSPLSSPNEFRGDVEYQIEMITGKKLGETNRRIFTKINSILPYDPILEYKDGYEWTKQFNGKQIFRCTSSKPDPNISHGWGWSILNPFSSESKKENMKCDNILLYYNNQSRNGESIRDIYYFIKHQLNTLEKREKKNIYFINILDDNSMEEYRQNIDKFNYLLLDNEYIFCGNIQDFSEWFLELKDKLHL